MPPTQTWKEVERRAADACNPGDGKRTPLSGMNSGHQTSSDGLNLNGLYIEVKHRQKHTALTLHKDVMAKAKREGKIPVTILHEHGMHGMVFMVHLADLDDAIRTLAINRAIGIFEPLCRQCGKAPFIEGEEDGYLVRRCAHCGLKIPYAKRLIDPKDSKQRSLFPRENSLPGGNNDDLLDRVGRQADGQ